MITPQDFIKRILRMQEEFEERKDVLKDLEQDIGFWEKFFDYREDPKYFLRKLNDYAGKDSELLKNCITGLNKFYPLSKPLLKVIYEDKDILQMFDNFKDKFIANNLRPLLYNDFETIVEKDFGDLKKRIDDLEKLDNGDLEKLKKEYEALKKGKAEKEDEFNFYRKETIELKKKIQELSPEKDKGEEELKKLKKNILDNLGCKETEELYKTIENIFEEHKAY